MSKKCPRKYLGTEKASLKKYWKGSDAFFLPWWCRWILATSLVHLIPKNVYNCSVQVWWEWNWGLFWAISSNNSISDIFSSWLEKYVIYLKTRGCVKCLQTKMRFVMEDIVNIKQNCDEDEGDNVWWGREGDLEEPAVSWGSWEEVGEAARLWEGALAGQASKQMMPWGKLTVQSWPTPRPLALWTTLWYVGMTTPKADQGEERVVVR